MEGRKRWRMRWAENSDALLGWHSMPSCAGGWGEEPGQVKASERTTEEPGRQRDRS